VSGPSARRRTVTFGVIAIVWVVFGLIVLWGLSGSDWLYGTYGEISAAQWEHLADLRDRLSQLDVAPDAVTVLDTALALPHPSTQDTLYELRRAIRALDPAAAHDDAVRQIRAELRTLMAAVEGQERVQPTHPLTFTPPPLPTLTPFIFVPVAGLPYHSTCGRIA